MMLIGNTMRTQEQNITVEKQAELADLGYTGEFDATEKTLRFEIKVTA